MEGKYTLKVDADGAESAYTVEGKGPDHLKVIGTAMQAVMRTFWHTLEQVQDEPVDMENLLKKANGEG